MEAEYQLTAEEAEKEMEQLRKVFTIVPSLFLLLLLSADILLPYLFPPLCIISGSCRCK